MDGSGNLYVAAGRVWELKPRPKTWWKVYLHGFGAGDGSDPWTAPVLDRLGNLYGTTYSGGATNNGTVYKLIPTQNGKGKVQWTEQILYSFAGVPDGANPIGQIVLDAVGNLYGTNPAAAKVRPL